MAESNKINIDNDIVKYIEENTDGNFDRVLSSDERWDVFYHLSEMRKSILNWYDFIKDAELLELGGGFGALTGMFCDKCKMVTVIEKSAQRAQAIKKRHQTKKNLFVLNQKIQDIVITKKFDYIVMVGLLETICTGSQVANDYVEILRNISKYLKPKGKLLLAVENRYGIRYFCGEADRHTRKPFSGLNRYPFGSDGYCFDKQEIGEIVKRAGFEYCKYYYPLPDYILPQTIYSQDYLPISNIKERVIPYFHYKDSLVAYENDLYDDLVRNNVFEFFSNSFLIECGNDQEFCDVIYAALTTDRGEKSGFSTTIHKSGNVKKTALYKKGVKQLQLVYRNMQSLQAHNIKCVKTVYNTDTLEMPYMKRKTLLDELRELILLSKEEFEQIFEQLYQCILKSSKIVNNNKNAISFDSIETKEFGVILETAYIDMIPINCFWIDGELVFFDQEFSKKYFPAKYVLYRALKYTYFFIPQANDILPLEKIKEKYGLCRVWDCFEKEEQRFVAENRKYEVYQHFRKWAAVDKNRIYKGNEC